MGITNQFSKFKFSSVCYLSLSLTQANSICCVRDLLNRFGECSSDARLFDSFRPRVRHSAVVWKDSMIIFGGHDNATTFSDLWLYNFSMISLFLYFLFHLLHTNFHLLSQLFTLNFCLCLCFQHHKHGKNWFMILQLVHVPVLVIQSFFLEHECMFSLVFFVSLTEPHSNWQIIGTLIWNTWNGMFCPILYLWSREFQAILLFSFPNNNVLCSILPRPRLPLFGFGSSQTIHGSLFLFMVIFPLFYSVQQPHSLLNTITFMFWVVLYHFHIHWMPHWLCSPLSISMTTVTTHY